MDARLSHFRLAEGPSSRGLKCDLGGLSLAGVQLLRKTVDGFALRHDEAVGALMLAAYGGVAEPERLSRGLQATAAALNRGDIGVAMIAALQLRLPELDGTAAERIRAVDHFLTKFDPNEPRDWRGRWTESGEISPMPGDKPTSNPGGHWDGMSHPTGGRLYQTGGGAEDDYGDNEPPPWEGSLQSEPRPTVDPPKVPDGWDQAEDGTIVRRPRLRNGQSWPEASPDAIRRILARGKPGAPPPTMWVYVPLDGKGPDLVGSDETGEFDEPSGYGKVRFVGTPQVTRSRGIETGHAADGVEEALRLAETNRFETIYFNRSLTTSTRRLYESRIRPDVLAVARPDLEYEITHFPYETLSPGQTPQQQQERMPRDVPWIGPVDTGSYKRGRLSWYEYLGVRPCS